MVNLKLHTRNCHAYAYSYIPARMNFQLTDSGSPSFLVTTAHACTLLNFTLVSFWLHPFPGVLHHHHSHPCIADTWYPWSYTAWYSLWPCTFLAGKSYCSCWGKEGEVTLPYTYSKLPPCLKGSSCVSNFPSVRFQKRPQAFNSLLHRKNILEGKLQQKETVVLTHCSWTALSCVFLMNG